MVDKIFDEDMIEKEAVVEDAAPVKVTENSRISRRDIDIDYIPNKNAPPEDFLEPKIVVDMSRVVTEPHAEYRTKDEQRAITKKRNARIQAIAQQLRENKAAEIERYNEAAKLWRSASDEQKANPNDALAEARALLEKGHPMTKKRAIAMATEEVSRTERE